MTSAATAIKPQLDTHTLLALFAGLVAWPAIYCSGIVGQIVGSIFIHFLIDAGAGPVRVPR